MSLRIAPTILRWLIVGSIALVVAAFGLFTLYFALRFAIWWPTAFGIDGTWRAALAFLTALFLIGWLKIIEWPEFSKKALDLVNRILWRI